jgi:phosphonate transport system ATP-binding protein
MNATTKLLIHGDNKMKMEQYHCGGSLLKTDHTIAPDIEIANLCKTFGETKALDNVSISVQPGEMVALIGASGSGKSTLLKHMSGLQVSDETESYIRVLNRTVQFKGDLNTRIRQIRADIGFIFQQFNLVGRLSLIANVMTGMLSRIPIWRSMLGWFTLQEKEMAMQALAEVGIAQYATQRASTLSGGQQQRAAVARAMIQQAKIIFADEPIASLDPESSRKVMRSLRDLNQKKGITVLVSLHQVDFAMQFCNRCVGLRNGQIVFDGPTAALDTELLRELYGAEYCDVEEGIDIYSRINGQRPSGMETDDPAGTEVCLPGWAGSKA